ncbi:MAG: hypothetical protein ABWY71_02965 [Candidatus Saccharimonadales bacterium]
MSLQALKRKPLLFIYTAGILLLLIAGYLWWNSVSTKTDRVWWSMVNHSLSTSGVTVQATQSGNGTKVRQTIQFSLGGLNQTHSLTTLSQAGTTVQDEMIATPTQDYTRYVDVKTDQKTASGKALNFSKVLGVWAKRDGQGQLFSQNVLGTGLPLGGVAIPIADLSPALRTKLVDQIRTQGVYDISFKDVQKQHKDGRLVYVYTAKIQPVLYASMMKSLAKSVGIHDLDSLDPKSFSSQQPFQMKLTVDVHAKQLMSAEAVGADIKQTYSSYDVPVEVSIPNPKDTISGTELQKRLTQLQQ